jgi:hypothetical protein
MPSVRRATAWSSMAILLLDEPFGSDDRRSAPERYADRPRTPGEDVTTRGRLSGTGHLVAG